MTGGKLGGNADSPSKSDGGLLETAELPMQIAEIQQHLHISRRDSQGALVGSPCVLVTLQTLEGKTEIIAGGQIARLNPQGAFVCLDGVLIPAKGPVRFSEIVVIAGIRIVDADGLLDQSDRCFLVARLVGDDSRKVECVWMIRIGVEDTTVDRTRSIELPGLVVPNGTIQLARDRVRSLDHGLRTDRRH